MIDSIINIQALSELINEAVESAVQSRVRSLSEELELIKKSQPAKEVLTLDDAAQYMGKSIFQVRSLIKKRAFPYYIEGKRKYLKISDINNFLLQNRNSSKSELEHEARKIQIELVTRQRRKMSKRS